MEQKITGAVGVSVPITGERTYLPYISEIKDRTIKYIDVVSCGYDINGGNTNIPFGDCTLSLIRKDTTEMFIEEADLFQFNPQYREGERMFVGEKIDPEKSFIHVTNANAVGKVCFFVFYWQDSTVTIPTATDIKRQTTNEAICVGIKSFLNDSRVLADKKIVGISPAVVTKDKNGNTNGFGEYSGMLTDAYLNLVKGSNIFFKNVPVLCLQRYNSWINTLCFEDVEIDMTNSFVQVSPQQIGFFMGDSFVFDFEYK